MNVFKTLAVMAFVVGFVACGGDGSASSPTDAGNEESSCANAAADDGSCTKNSSSSAKKSDGESSSNKSDYFCEIYTLTDALRCACGEEQDGKISLNVEKNIEFKCSYDEYQNRWVWVEIKAESSSSEVSSSSEETKDKSSSSVKPASSSSSRHTDYSSSRHSGLDPESPSSFVPSSSSVASSSSVIVSSSSKTYDHRFPLAGDLLDRYKTFVDPRNGRSYYYITITGEDLDDNLASVTVMAENLNIGVDVAAPADQANDEKIERYCYNNDTTFCEKYGGLYQWAEMMQLPSRCNKESCSDLIKANHQGICPDGWRLLTRNDMQIVINADGNRHGVEGVRSEYGFNGYNSTGYSLVGSGYLFDGEFKRQGDATCWFYPSESNQDLKLLAVYAFLTKSEEGSINPLSQTSKVNGFPVRCVMVETEE